MIQRIQSVWLFLASMMGGALLMPSMVLYHYEKPNSLIATDKNVDLSATGNLPLLLIAAVMTILPLIAIFMFKNRKQQRGMTVLAIFNCIIFYSVLMMRVSKIRTSSPLPQNETYGVVGALLPLLAIVFLILAIVGIRKDQKLIKSLDRLR